MTYRDIFAGVLLESYQLEAYEKPLVPFCGTVFAWASDPYSGDDLLETFNGLSEMTVSKNDGLISGEALVQNLADVSLLIGGFYPLLDLDDEKSAKAYQKFSLVSNKESTHQVLEWIYKNLILKILQTDKVGFMVALNADSDALADKKLAEVVDLLFDNGNFGGKYSQRHGKGTIISPDGDQYVGEFRDGKYHGQGTLILANGGKYVGEWRDHKPNGQGTYTLADGEKLVGEFKDGEFVGEK